MRNRLAVLGALISLLVLLLICWRMDWRGVGENMRRLGWKNWLIGAVIYLSAFLPRGWRWKLMLPDAGRLPWGWLTKSVVIGYAANNVLPFRLGEVVRSYVVGERYQISKLTCLATIAAEKVLDGCCLLGLLAACLPFLQLRSGSAGTLNRMFILASALFGAAMAACFILAFLHQPALHLAERFLSQRIVRWVQAGLKATAMFRRGKILLGAVALTVVIWLLEGGCFIFFSGKLGIDNAWAAGIFCLVIVNLSILVPSAPGYVGVFQAGSVAAFMAMGYEASTGLAMGAATHAAQFIPTTLIGLALASAMGLNWRRLYHLRNE
jgi:hypothetical protein